MKSLNLLIFKSCNSRHGFTVLEAIVAIALLSVSISGVFTSVQRGLSQSVSAKDEVKAFYLAQEAVEMIRNIRDANQLNRIVSNPSATWLDGITSNCPFNRVCSVDVTTFAFVNCGATWGSCPQNLRQHPSTFLYSYTSGNTTNFKREIQIEQVNSTEISVTVQVSWTQGATTRQFKAKTHLFNWI